MRAVVASEPGQRGLQRLDPRPDQPAILFGAGTMGLILAILHSFPPAIDAIRRNAGRLAPLVTDQFSLEGIEEASAMVHGGRAIKAVVTPGPVVRG